jgi:hypothetical protein
MIIYFVVSVIGVNKTGGWYFITPTMRSRIADLSTDVELCSSGDAIVNFATRCFPGSCSLYTRRIPFVSAFPPYT